MQPELVGGKRSSKVRRFTLIMGTLVIAFGRLEVHKRRLVVGIVNHFGRWQYNLPYMVFFLRETTTNCLVWSSPCLPLLRHEIIIIAYNNERYWEKCPLTSSVERRYPALAQTIPPQW